MSAPSEPLLHPLLARRWSPTRFDRAHEASLAEVDSLLEAARWAPSVGNSQPWAFVPARRGESDHERLVRHLAPSSARWAPSASVLVANLAHRYVQDTDWEFSEFAVYALGQAVAHMTFQALSLGLFARQFRALDRDALAAEFDVPEYWEVTTMSGFGKVATDEGRALSALHARSSARQRRSRADLVWPDAGEQRSSTAGG
jgi:nitroreductase